MDLNYCASSANASPRPSSCSPPAPARAIAPAASTPAPTIICPNPSAPKNSSPASAPYCAAPATPRPLRRRSSKPATSALTQPRARSGARTSWSRSPPSNSTSWRSWPAPPAAPSPATSSPPCFTSAAPRPTNARSTCTSATCAKSSNARIAPSSAPSAAWDTSSPHEGLHQNSPVEFRHAGALAGGLHRRLHVCLHAQYGARQSVSASPFPAHGGSHRVLADRRPPSAPRPYAARCPPHAGHLLPHGRSRSRPRHRRRSLQIAGHGAPGHRSAETLREEPGGHVPVRRRQYRFLVVLENNFDLTPYLPYYLLILAAVALLCWILATNLASPDRKSVCE